MQLISIQIHILNSKYFRPFFATIFSGVNSNRSDKTYIKCEKSRTREQNIADVDFVFQKTMIILSMVINSAFCYIQLIIV